jgi:hypothetical protein
MCAGEQITSRGTEIIVSQIKPPAVRFLVLALSPMVIPYDLLEKEHVMKLINSAICVALFALGSGVILPSTAAGTLASLEARQDGPVSFVSGGVGEEERQQIEKLSADYPLQLLFATKGSPNEYLADVKVQIKDKDGKMVLDAVSQGPFLLAKMPAGKYSISADSEGVVKRQTVQVTAAKPQRVVFVW